MIARASRITLLGVRGGSTYEDDDGAWGLGVKSNLVEADTFFSLSGIGEEVGVSFAGRGGFVVPSEELLGGLVCFFERASPG